MTARRTKKAKAAKTAPPARTRGAARWNALLAELEDAARRLDVAVRYDARLPGAGGFCRVRGARLALVNSRLHESEQALVLAQSLRAADPERLDALALRPGVRALIEGAPPR